MSRRLLVAIAGLVWGTSLACGTSRAENVAPAPAANSAVSSPETEILEFPEVFFSSQTFAPLLGPGGCVIKPSVSLPAQLRTLACEPDPKVEICRSIDSRVKGKAKAIQARLDQYTAELSQQRVQSILAVAGRAGVAPPAARKAEHEDFSRGFWKKVEAEQDSRRASSDARLLQELEKSRPQVESRIKQVRDTLIETIQRSRGLGAEGTILADFLSCKLELDIELKRGGLSDNAFMGSVRDVDAGRGDYEYALHEGRDVTLTHSRRTDLSNDSTVRINPLSAAIRTCQLSLTPRIWLACAQSESMCVQFMMHEFGHVLHSCYIQKLGTDAEAEARNASTESERIRLEFLGKQARKVAGTLFERTACLAGLVAPGGLNVGVPSQCAARPLPQPGTIEERCQNQSVTGYPGQWVEAEADFWGASGMARYLEKFHPTLPERARVMYEAWALNCQNEVELGQAFKRANPGTPAEIAEANRYEKTVLSLGATQELEKKKEGCEALPANRSAAAPKPWGDAHQDWDLRVNRNFLRNTDMRRALGCEKSQQSVPLTCGL